MRLEAQIKGVEPTCGYYGEQESIHPHMFRHAFARSRVLGGATPPLSQACWDIRTFKVRGFTRTFTGSNTGCMRPIHAGVGESVALEVAFYRKFGFIACQHY